MTLLFSDITNDSLDSRENNGQIYQLIKKKVGCLTFVTSKLPDKARVLSSAPFFSCCANSKHKKYGKQ